MNIRMHLVAFLFFLHCREWIWAANNNAKCSVSFRTFLRNAFWWEQKKQPQKINTLFEWINDIIIVLWSTDFHIKKKIFVFCSHPVGRVDMLGNRNIHLTHIYSWSDETGPSLWIRLRSFWIIIIGESQLKSSIEWG